MDILDKLKLLNSGKTYIQTPGLDHYRVTGEAIAEIQQLRTENQRLKAMLAPTPTAKTKVRYIGDVHGKMDQYLKLIDGVESSVQVGDFGAGFVPLPELGDQHRFIRGNHDSPEICRSHPGWIRDGAYDGECLYIGGAWSIDQQRRTAGINWWPDEELTILEFENIILSAERLCPQTIISHDCPSNVVGQLFGLRPIQTRTQQALDVVLDVCEPKLWIFGHWHQDVDMMINGTRFICLDELSYIDI